MTRPNVTDGKWRFTGNVKLKADLFGLLVILAEQARLVELPRMYTGWQQKAYRVKTRLRLVRFKDLPELRTAMEKL